MAPVFSSFPRQHRFGELFFSPESGSERWSLRNREDFLMIFAPYPRFILTVKNENGWPRLFAQKNLSEEHFRKFSEKTFNPSRYFCTSPTVFSQKKLEGVSKIAYRACVNFPSNCPAMSDLASMPSMPRSSAAPFRRRPLFAAAQRTLKAKVDVNLNAVCKLARFYSYHEGRTLGSVPCLMPGGRSTCCQELKVWDRRKEPFSPPLMKP